MAKHSVDPAPVEGEATPLPPWLPRHRFDPRLLDGTEGDDSGDSGPTEAAPVAADGAVPRVNPVTGLPVAEASADLSERKPELGMALGGQEVPAPKTAGEENRLGPSAANTPSAQLKEATLAAALELGVEARREPSAEELTQGAHNEQMAVLAAALKSSPPGPEAAAGAGRNSAQQDLSAAAEKAQEHDAREPVNPQNSVQTLDPKERAHALGMSPDVVDKLQERQPTNLTTDLKAQKQEALQNAHQPNKDSHNAQVSQAVNRSEVPGMASNNLVGNAGAAARHDVHPQRTDGSAQPLNHNNYDLSLMSTHPAASKTANTSHNTQPQDARTEPASAR